MRTAGFRPPRMPTWPTPLSSARRWPISVSARSDIARTGIVFEVSAISMTAVSAGFTLE